MRFKSFEIRNFKGVEHAIVDLSPAGSNIATLIGLNESGKTTVLEAISRFSRTNAEQALYLAAAESDDPVSFVPKHRKSNFTGRITVEATIDFDPGEKIDLIKEVEALAKCKIDPNSVPDSLKVTRGHQFENSDLKCDVHTWTLSATAKAKGAKNYKKLSNESAEWTILANAVTRHLPQVVYFPTFLFTQPERVVLNPGKGEEPVNRLYRQIVQHVAQSLPNPLDIQKHIVERVVTPDSVGQQILSFWGLGSDKQEQVSAALNELSAHLTETVFESWSKIFGGDFSGREIILRPGVDNTTPDSPKVYLQFALKDGTSQYDIGERSLGFRWFFSFLLFTLYRVSARSSAPTLFLLDEPASNLHSRAQLQLVSSLPRIAKGSNQIIYSTHSHYMINPDWLDQAFIVSNGAVDYDDVNETNKPAKGRHTSISIEKYRNFVGKHPDRTTYFQPVLDKLDVVPSRLDLVKKSVLVEGKGDYLALEYGRRVLLGIEGSFSTVPTKGATGLDELVGLFLGWAVPFVICLDADKAGVRAKATYIKEWGLSEARVFTLGDLDPSLQGKSIEGLLEPADMELIGTHFGLKVPPSKSQIQLFFSEMLARRELVKMSAAFVGRVKAFEQAMANAFGAG